MLCNACIASEPGLPLHTTAFIQCVLTSQLSFPETDDVRPRFLEPEHRHGWPVLAGPRQDPKEQKPSQGRPHVPVHGSKAIVPSGRCMHLVPSNPTLLCMRGSTLQDCLQQGHPTSIGKLYLSGI